MKSLKKIDEYAFLQGFDDGNCYMPQEYGGDIFHYTSSSGFSSILLADLDHVILWASRYDCLNDISEGSVAETMFYEVCGELLSEKEITQELYELFSKTRTASTTLLFHKEGDMKKGANVTHDRYISSFSKNPDSLAMWNYYSKGSKFEGFNIGFSPLSMQETLTTYLCDKEATFNICPVIYDRDKQKQLVRHFLTKLIKYYEKGQEFEISGLVSIQLQDWGLLFKHECFQHEEEVRIIIDIAKSGKNIPVDYRIVSGHIVPYIKLPLNKSDVSCVNFGPLQCGEKQKQHLLEVMEEMMETTGYSVSVGASKVPVRY